jgi:tetratricopeptide (TPR) repeat protein
MVAQDGAVWEVAVSKKASRRSSEAAMPPFDRRAMEKMMADIGRLLSERDFDSTEGMNAYLNDMIAAGGPVAAAPRTPLEEAQDLMYEAYNASGKRRVQLARRALEISPDCADCYVLLAEETAGSLEEARDLYEQGVKAGERAIGPEGFREYRGEFWGILETRPYMRARAGLAHVLWLLGERRQAVEHLQDMLRLNPDDNQGLRYLLIRGRLLGRVAVYQCSMAVPARGSNPQERAGAQQRPGGERLRTALPARPQEDAEATARVHQPGGGERGGILRGRGRGGLAQDRGCAAVARRTGRQPGERRDRISGRRALSRESGAAGGQH